ncbi:pectinesterase family protein [Flavobacterium agrisoli]|uniref:Ig-like domain-containing protein n=1 Tax=Flavobacterium agrisoli TaxID=2793066 RepID=A0A934PNJ6_9FLAO|nr:pectinesterase family protein [Flavobacterium agrisoli]MBK0370193.1 Ig-like domain-containing protein [Flavobacterium agrisoli]
MKPKLFSKFSLLLYFILNSFLSLTAQTLNNETTTISWPLTTGNVGQTATYSGTTNNYFLQDYITIGTNLNYAGIKTVTSLPGTGFQPTTQSSAVDASNLIGFHLIPKNGLSFTPTQVSFRSTRYGTGGGLLDVYWESSDGTAQLLVANLNPNRDNNTTAPNLPYTLGVYDLSNLPIPASNAKCTLAFYLHDLGNTKQVSLADVVVTGTVNGTINNLPQYNITTSVVPSEGGSITSFPVSNVHYQGTEVTLTATKNFGYTFLNWTDESGNIVSTNNTYTFTANSDVTLKANFTQLNTYSLTIPVNGGAKDYMIAISPVGTIVNGSRLYEEGTTVSLTANNNPILNFSNWETGETNATISVVMNATKNISAQYNASDYIVGWDFYKTGNNSRIADFSSDVSNETAALILRNESGTQVGWLGKSVLEGGYEGRGAAVNWQPLTNKNYYQIKFNAADYKDISIKSAMLFNYNAYSKQICQYSTDGTTFTTLGTFDLVNAKQYYEATFNLPVEANNKSEVYIRWVPDYTSAIVGATATNDGTTLSGIYVLGTKNVLNDGTPPILVSSVPAINALGASATGKVVLTFDERIKITPNAVATLNEKNISPVIFGKSISFDYSGLQYNTTYTFTLPANIISDLGNNTYSSPISITFTTLNKPIVSKKKYDFVVGVDGDFSAALAAAQAASSSGERFYIFFPNGEYDLGKITGDATQQTFFNLPNVSFIGQSMDGVILFNEPLASNEGIGTTPTLNFQTNAKNIYMQDITLLNKMDYRKGAFTGRAVALRDQGDRNIYKNVKLLSNQDTFYTGANRIYLENSEIHGTVDFIFGGGDVFFNSCLIYLEDRSGNHVTAPATTSSWGYVFRDCTIDGFAINNGSYKLSRPWQGSPKVAFINTIMKQLPANEGWSEWGALPSVYAEFNSLTASGVAVDLSGRRKTYSNGTNSVTLNPVLTKTQADAYTIENVLGGTDTWQPTLATEQASIPVISNNSKKLEWATDDYVLGWAIFKDDVFIKFTTSNQFDASAYTTGKFTVRAANAMGGLSVSSNLIDLSSLGLSETIILHNQITLSPNPTKNSTNVQIGGFVENTTFSLYDLNGQVLWTKNTVTGNNELTPIDLQKYSSGIYILKVTRESNTKNFKIIKN